MRKPLVITIVTLFILIAGFYGVRMLVSHKDELSDEWDKSYTRLSSRFGERKTVWLPDSTRVILNSDSRLMIPADFNAERRVVELDGDAFFEVAAEERKPFIVRTGMLVVTVLGTAFRIAAHREDAGQRLELLRGKLKVQKGYPSEFDEAELLEGGDMILINRDIDLMEKETYDTTELLSWRKGALVFSATPFGEGIKRLEDWYGVEIEVKKTPGAPPPFNGTFSHERLEAVLDRLIGAGHYSIRDRRVIIAY
ncbi:FecR family protein [Compostibacter hankyongensis]